MPRRTIDPLIRPRRRLPAAALLWLAWGLAALAVLAGSALLVAERVSVPVSRSYGGTLSPDGNAVVVDLPAGLPLQAVLVRPGQTVRAGQTLAVYDRTRIAATLAALERDIIALAARRDCLMTPVPAVADPQQSPPAPPDRRPGAGPPARPDPETALRIRAAVEACHTDRAARALDRQRLTRARDRLAARHALIGRQIALGLADAPPEAKPAAARKTLALALEQNRLQAQIDTLELEEAARAIAHNRERLADIDATTRQITTARSTQAELAAALKTPRLPAPEAGTIARVRPIPTGQPMTRAEAFIDIEDPEAQAYTATITLTPAQAATLTHDTPVTLTLIGYPDPKPTLKGKIDHFDTATTQSGTTRVTATIKINKNDQQKLTKNKTTIALNAKQTAANIKVRKDAGTVFRELADVWHRTISARFTLEKPTEI